MVENQTLEPTNHKTLIKIIVLIEFTYAPKRKKQMNKFNVIIRLHIQPLEPTDNQNDFHFTEPKIFDNYYEARKFGSKQLLKINNQNKLPWCKYDFFVYENEILIYSTANS